MSALIDAELSTRFQIDPRSFHVFEFQGDRILFDRATATTSELNDLAFDTLQLIRQGATVDAAVQQIAVQYDLDAPDELRESLMDLKRRGFFRYWEVEPMPEEALEALWRHKPKRIQLLMAEGCNLGCRYCYQWRNGTNQRKTLMPWAIAQKAVDTLVARSGERPELQITFFGGEPLLNYPMIQKVVEYCRSIEHATGKSFQFELITNGTLLTRDVVDFIVRERFLLFISLDGDQEMHEYNRPSIDGGHSHETIVRHALYANLQYEKHKLPRIKIRANLTNRYNDRQKVEKYFESLGFKLIGIGPIEPLPHGDPSPAAMSEDQMDELEERDTRAMVQALHDLLQGMPLGPAMARTFNQMSESVTPTSMHGITCGVCRNTTVVDNRGNLYPCHRYAEMKEYCIGDVETGMSRERVLDYYRKINGHSTDDCQNCWIRDYCSGGCAWLLSDKDGVIHHPTPRECARRRRNMELGIWVRKEMRHHFPERFDGKGPLALEEWDWNSSCVDRDLPGISTSTLPPSPLSHAVTGAVSGRPSESRVATSLPSLPILTTSAGSCGSCSDTEKGCGCSGSGLLELQFLSLPPEPVPPA